MHLLFHKPQKSQWDVVLRVETVVILPACRVVKVVVVEVVIKVVIKVATCNVETLVTEHVQEDAHALLTLSKTN